MSRAMVDSRTVAIRSLLTEQYVRVNDRHGVEHAGWVRLGAWLFGCLADQAEVRWVMMDQLIAQDHNPLPNKITAANAGWRPQFCRGPGWLSGITLSGVAEPER